MRHPCRCLSWGIVVPFLFGLAALSGCARGKITVAAGSAIEPAAEEGEWLVLMSAGGPTPATLEYKRLLKECCGVEYRYGLLGVVPADKINANNKKVKEILERRHCTGILEKLLKEAQRKEEGAPPKKGS